MKCKMIRLAAMLFVASFCKTYSDVRFVNATPYPIRGIMFVENVHRYFNASDPIEPGKYQWIHGDKWSNKWRYVVQVLEEQGKPWKTIWDTADITGGKNWNSPGNREILVYRNVSGKKAFYDVRDIHLVELPPQEPRIKFIGQDGKEYYKNAEPMPEKQGKARDAKWWADADWTPEYTIDRLNRENAGQPIIEFRDWNPSMTYQP